jgi:hypothetical protein
MDLVAPFQDHDMSDMDQSDGEDVIEEQWQRYVAAREEALAARARQPAADQECCDDRQASTAVAPIARVLHLMPRRPARQ